MNYFWGGEWIYLLHNQLQLLLETKGYYLSDRINLSNVVLFVTMILPLHFTTLTAKSSKNIYLVSATVLGGVASPFIVELSNSWVAFGAPIIVGILLSFIKYQAEK